MDSLNATIQSVPYLADVFKETTGMVNTLNYIVGGFFGLYLFFSLMNLLIKWRQGKKSVKRLKNIDEKLGDIKMLLESRQVKSAVIKPIKRSANDTRKTAKSKKRK